jgi:hypothetical protein
MEAPTVQKTPNQCDEESQSSQPRVRDSDAQSNSDKASRHNYEHRERERKVQEMGDVSILGKPVQQV